MTNDEKNQILYNVLRLRWPRDCEYAVNKDGSAADLTNHDLIWRGIGGKDFTEEQLYNFVMELRAQGLLVKKLGPEVVDPGKTLPHDDIPALKSIRNMADVIRVKNMPAELLKQFKFLVPPKPGVASVAFEHLNARIKYIMDNNIGDGEPETVSEEKTAVKKPIFSVPPEVTQSHELVEAMTLANVGSVNSDEGRRTTLAKRQKKFHADIDAAHANRESAKKILQDTKDAIRKSGESSIG
jgi:hypothetical protein